MPNRYIFISCNFFGMVDILCRAKRFVWTKIKLMETYSLHINNYSIRTEMHQGRRHLVVPAIMMREGVHCGSHGPLLHPAEELGKYTSAWNGMPVIVRHPQDSNGNYISANSPNVVDMQVIGRVYNTSMSNDKLRAEVWIDEEKTRQVSPETLAYINQNRPLDVSVGVFTDDEESTGTWNGEEYTAIARNHRPDHLALLPGEQGACSWADGCGIRANKKGGDVLDEIHINALSYSGTESTAWSAPTLADFNVEGQWQGLSQADKAKVASHYLIGSSAVETFGDLHFPVVNPSTGRLNEGALRAVIGGRGAQLTAVPASVRDAARRRAYRLLNSEFDAELEIPETLSAVYQLKKQGYSVIQINQDPEYTSIAGTLQGKLDNMDTDTRIHYLRKLYANNFVYEVRNNGNSTLFQRGYSVNDNGDVEIIGDPVEVVIEENVKLKTNKGGADNMCTPNEQCAGLAAKVDCVIKNNSKFTEEDRELLSTFSEEQFDRIIAAAAQPKEADPQMNKEEAVQVLKDHLSDPGKFMGLLPDDTRAQMEYGMKAYKQRRTQLIEHITANTEAYTAEILEGRDIDELERLAGVIKTPVDYSAMSIQSNAGSGSGGKLLPAGIKTEKGGEG